MKNKDKTKILELIKNHACFYQVGDKQYRLEMSVNITNDDTITELRKFFTEE